MKPITISPTCTIELYASIKELPIHIRKKFDHYLIQDIGIGSSMADLDAHLEKSLQFLMADKKDEAKDELMNLRYNFNYMLHEWDFKSMAFACLVAKVNGEPFKDLTDDGLIKLVDTLSEQGLTGAMVEEILSDVKKNLIPNAAFCRVYIPMQLLTSADCKAFCFWRRAIIKAFEHKFIKAA